MTTGRLDLQRVAGGGVGALTRVIRFGEHDESTLRQLHNVAGRAERVALMADGHVGYVMPIDGVAAYRTASGTARSPGRWSLAIAVTDVLQFLWIRNDSARPSAGSLRRDERRQDTPFVSACRRGRCHRSPRPFTAQRPGPDPSTAAQSR